MRFSVGYKFFDENDNPMAESLCKMAERIEEVYFPWNDTETCRASLVNDRGYINWDGQAFMENDLRMLKDHNIKLNLLLNANCYGEKSISNYLKNYVCSIIEHIQDDAGGLDFVTTTSPFIARMVKKNFPEVKTRASVNMRIGNIIGMRYLEELFDGFYIQRDYNRNLVHLKEVKEWTDSKGKTLHLLANSGCMKFCSGQVFHDNVVAHEKYIKEIQNVEDFNTAICWDYYAKKENWVSLMQNTWIRPEDIHKYEGLFTSVKLATRMTLRPLSVIKAYIAGEYRGNLLDLTEPNHTAALKGYCIDNKKFPSDWFERASSCSGKCHNCNYCSSVLERVLTKVTDVEFFEESS
jgi:collagenase-like PrtC family protease